MLLAFNSAQLIRESLESTEIPRVLKNSLFLSAAIQSPTTQKNLRGMNFSDK